MSSDAGDPGQFDFLIDTEFWAAVPGIGSDLPAAEASVARGERTSVAELREQLAASRWANG